MRYSTGYVRKQRGKYIGAWYSEGERISKTLGLIKELTKGEAREKLAALIKESRLAKDETLFGAFVEQVYFPFYKRKWKHSTAAKQVNLINVHLVSAFKDRPVASFKRDELQDFLDAKAQKFSFSAVSKFRWDLKQIFDMAVAEGHIGINPAVLLFIPRSAAKGPHRTMTTGDVRLLVQTLDQREKLIASLSLLAGMRPGETFAARWQDVGEAFVQVRQRVYEGVLDSPKSERGYRKVAFGKSLRADLEAWRTIAGGPNSSAFIFASERGTPLGKNNVWNRNMKPKLKTVGLEWANFQVMRRTFLTLCKAMGGDPKIAADQAGHDIGVSLREYVQTPIEAKLELVNKLETLLE